MARNEHQLGIIGLGRIGGGLAAQALEKHMRVAGYDLKQPSEELRDAGLITIERYAQFKEHLDPPRAILVYVPAGPVVDQVLDELAGELDAGDVIVDGGNSYWGDSIRRQQRLARRHLRFVDLGTSGGVAGAERGACFMAGGERDAVEVVEPILKSLAVENGYVHAGPPGAGHFVKLVHNGIEFGMLQAIGEGVALLENYSKDRGDLDITEVLRCWGHGSVIRSWLIELMERSYRTHGGTDDIPSYVEDTGEVNWLIDDAMHMEVPVPVMAQSIMQLLASRDPHDHSARAIAMMRHEFGGHPFGPEQSIASERRKGRLGGFVDKSQ